MLDEAEPPGGAGGWSEPPASSSSYGIVEAGESGLLGCRDCDRQLYSSDQSDRAVSTVGTGLVRSLIAGATPIGIRVGGRLRALPLPLELGLLVAARFSLVPRPPADAVGLVAAAAVAADLPLACLHLETV